MHIGAVDSIWNWPFSQFSDLRDLDLGLGHMAYRHVSLIDLFTHQILFKSEEHFMDRWAVRPQINCEKSTY